MLVSNVSLRYGTDLKGSNISTQNDSARLYDKLKLSYRQKAKVQILTLQISKGQYLGLIYFKNLQKSERQKNNNSSDNSLTSPYTGGGENIIK